jgi:predicted TIM-barrel fold metal-dependent hydrolase
MDELSQRWGVSAWKTYTQYGPNGEGFFLHDDVGIRFIEKARALGVKNICIHKGLPFGRRSYEHSQCSDIGIVARRFPDVNFLIYHSGFVSTVTEQAYDPSGQRDGIDTLITSLRRHEVKPNGNVYAELGSTWRFLMRDPEQAAHALGKLIVACGEDNVLWGTDSIWYGSPQDQIQALRSFQITAEFQERYGYPELTDEIKHNIFWRNAATLHNIDTARLPCDTTPAEREEARASSRLPNRTYGPETATAARKVFKGTHPWAFWRK